MTKLEERGHLMVPRLVVGLALDLGGILSPRSKWDAYVLDQSGIFCSKIESVIHVESSCVMLKVTWASVVLKWLKRRLVANWSPPVRSTPHTRDDFHRITPWQCGWLRLKWCLGRTAEAPL